MENKSFEERSIKNPINIEKTINKNNNVGTVLPIVNNTKLVNNNEEGKNIKKQRIIQYHKEFKNK